MQREFLLDDGRPVVKLRDVTDPDEHDFGKFVDSFSSSTAHGTAGMVQLLREDFALRRISSEAIERCSKWCNSGATFTSAVDPARQLSQVLFGCVPERLIDERGRRVADYDARVDRLRTRLVTK